jgi:hypothetical protein
MLGEIVKKDGLQLDYAGIWSRQNIDSKLIMALETISAEINRQLISPPPGISNISEWAKKEGCWDDRLLPEADRISGLLSPDFRVALVSKEEGKMQKRSDRDTQRIDNGIEAQRRVLAIPGEAWRSLLSQMTHKGLLSPKERGIMGVAAAMPARLPSEMQSRVLVMLLERARAEGLLVQKDN